MMTAAALLVIHLALVASTTPSGPQAAAAAPVGATIAGTVRDSSGRAVAGAVVVLRPESGAERQTATAADGRFTLPSVSGAAVLVVRAGGFAEARQTLASGSSGPLEVVLAPAGVSETVTVTATRGEQRTGDLPASISVLGRQEIRSSPAVVADDVLRQIPSFSLFRRTSSL